MWLRLNEACSQSCKRVNKMGNYIIVLDKIGVDQVLVRNNWEKLGKGDLQPKVNSKRDELRSIGVGVRAVAS